MGIMDVRRKLSELKLDLMDLLDHKFVDESDERVIVGFVDKTINAVQDLVLEVDMLVERLDMLEKEVRSKAAEKKIKAKKVKAKKVKKTKKVKKKAKAKKTKKKKR